MSGQSIKTYCAAFKSRFVTSLRNFLLILKQLQFFESGNKITLFFVFVLVTGTGNGSATEMVN